MFIDTVNCIPGVSTTSPWKDTSQRCIQIEDNIAYDHVVVQADEP